MRLEPFTPRNFGRDYVEIVGSQQYSMFVATCNGIKPCYDEWVELPKYQHFLDTCSKYGLIAEPDVIFQDSVIPKGDVIGKENITTTFTSIKPFSEEIAEGKVHVFVAKDKRSADEAKKWGFYTGGIIGNRSINKPFVDHLRFGVALGFPSCCVDFFARYNDWHRFNHPLETYKNTPVKGGRPIGSYLCNNFLMDNTYFLIHHLPCSYRCQKTIDLAKRVEKVLIDVEPEYCDYTVKLLKMPLLVIGERHFIMFDGKLERNRIDYTSTAYLFNPARPEEKVEFHRDIDNGDSIIFDDRNLSIYKGSQLIKTIKKGAQWFLVDWE